MRRRGPCGTMGLQNQQQRSVSMKILAVDYGDSRTGLAVCDPGEVLATPLKPQIEEKAMKALNEDGRHQLSVLHDMIASMPEFSAEALDTLLHEVQK